MDFLVKIQKLPEFSRQTLLSSVMIILALTLFIFWLKIPQKLKSFQLDGFKASSFL